uniref:WAP domain-containing protein n=1 Tax=Graphocephala atropunctata TaxID=36148 RepID=A0A1B6KRN5_9HEMI
MCTSTTPFVITLSVIISAGTLCLSQPTKSDDQEGPLNLAFSKMALFNEEPCLQAGGLCLEKENCPEGKLTEERGLCAEQQKRGVECCLSVSKNVTDCMGLGGVCRDSCPESIQIKRAEDCKTQICCALVN